MSGRFPRAFVSSAIALVLLASGCATQSQAQDAPAERATIEVTQATFGSFHPERSDGPGFVPATRIPFAVGGSYGWILQVRTSRPTIKYRDELMLPEPAAHWDQPTGAEQTVAADGKSAVAEREATVENGQIHGGWGMAEGDPRGRYVSKVTLEDGQVLIFEFDIE